jgi:hypothetical protein
MWVTTDIYGLKNPYAGGVLQLVAGLPGKPDHEAEYSLRDAEIAYSFSTREDFCGHNPHALYTKTFEHNFAHNSIRVTRFISYKNGIQVGYLFDRDLHVRYT